MSKFIQPIENISVKKLTSSEKGGEKVLYETNTGKLMMPEQVEEMSLWEIDDLGVHIALL